MPRSDEAQAFFHAVYSAVQEIPHGKVTTYGHIAMLVGTRTKPSLTHPKFPITNVLQLKDLVKSASVSNTSPPIHPSPSTTTTSHGKES